MFRIIRSAPVYFICLLLFLIIAGFILGTIEKGDAILFFGQHRSPFGDFFFTYFTKLGEEHIYIILVSIFLFVRYRFAILSVSTGVCALLLAWGLKMYFGHPRPYAYFSSLERLLETNPVDGVHLYSGMMSFPSGHTMSAFAVYTFVALLYAHKPWWSVILFIFALLVGISRIYLVQHFLEDVYLGAILGTLVGIGVFWINDRFPINELRWVDRSFKIRKPIAKKG